METTSSPSLVDRVANIRTNDLAQQNLVLFAGGVVAGAGSFVYHAIAGRWLGPPAYGQVAFLIAAYSVGSALALIITLILARYIATLTAAGDEARIGSVLRSAIVTIGGACVLAVLLSLVLSAPVATFEHMASFAPVVLVGASIAIGWQLAIARGALQGLHRFRSLAANLSLEAMVRTIALFALLGAGYSVSGAMGALSLGLGAALMVGLYALRGYLRVHGPKLAIGTLMSFSVTATVGVLGVQVLLNQDVILAEHYLGRHDGGIYGGLSKIGSIGYYLTLSVSQVLFPRVVRAVASGEQPHRILLLSLGLVTALGIAVIGLYAVFPQLVVLVLFGAGFRDAIPFVLPMGLIGVGLSLNNLLIQFFMALRDRWFISALIASTLFEAGLIISFHASIEQIILDVVTTQGTLLAALTFRCLVVLRYRT